MISHICYAQATIQRPDEGGDSQVTLAPRPSGVRRWEHCWKYIYGVEKGDL